MGEKRAVCLNCIDGRAQMPVIRWITDQCEVDYVDMITEPGMDGYLADEANSLTDIIRKIRISIERNNATTIVVAAHYDCRGNPVDEGTHKQQIHAAVARLQQAIPCPKIVGVWINSDWEGERIAE